MNGLPLSDLASSISLQTQMLKTRADLQRAGTELTTGQIGDLRELPGDGLERVFLIDNDLARLAATEIDLSRAANQASTSQAALASITSLVGSTGVELLGALGREDTIAVDDYIARASTVLDGVVAAFTTKFAGVSLFSGAAEDQLALAPADTLIAGIEAIVSTAPDATTAAADIDAFFNMPGGDFEATIYGGSSLDTAPVALADGSRVSYQTRADQQEARDLLKALSKLAVADSANFGGSTAEQALFLTQAADELQAATTGIVRLQSEIGVAEQRLAEGLEQAQAEANALQQIRNDLTTVDQFVGATRFNDLQGQLESLYTVTARLSSLRFTNFIR